MSVENKITTKEQNKTFSVMLSEKLDSVSDALPKDFNKARFVQNSLALLNESEQLRKYKPTQIMSGLLKGAYLGLDFFNKECYLVPYGEQLNYQTDYRGAKKLAKKYSIRPIKDIYAKLIRKGDIFEESINNGEKVFYFKPIALNDSDIIGAFAVVLYKDGGVDYDVMTLAELENTRNHSKASNSPAWKNFTGEMYKKTVLHRLCKQIELDFENPTQRNTFISGMEVETDIAQDVAYEISQNANTEELIVEEPKELPLREPTTTVEAVKAAQAKKSPSKVESTENELPGFMTMEDM